MSLSAVASAVRGTVVARVEVDETTGDGDWGNLAARHAARAEGVSIDGNADALRAVDGLGEAVGARTAMVAPAETTVVRDGGEWAHLAARHAERAGAGQAPVVVPDGGEWAHLAARHAERAGAGQAPIVVPDIRQFRRTKQAMIAELRSAAGMTFEARNAIAQRYIDAEPSPERRASLIRNFLRTLDGPERDAARRLIADRQS